MKNVCIKAGWIAKDSSGVAWYASKPFPRGDLGYFLWELSGHGICRLVDQTGKCIEDPWETSHPDGGPDCLMEITP